MKNAFELEPTRNVAANGTLDSIGLEWTEQASWRHTMRPMVGLGFIMSLVFAAVGLFATSALGLIWLIAAGGGIYMAVFCLTWILGSLPRRSVVFARDGTIYVPHGVPGNKGLRRLARTQFELASIEIGSSASVSPDWTSTVKLVSGAGRTVTISEKLHQEEAREVAVGLNLALRTMRASVGQEPVRTTRKRYDRALVD